MPWKLQVALFESLGPLIAESSIGVVLQAFPLTQGQQVKPCFAIILLYANQTSLLAQEDFLLFICAGLYSARIIDTSIQWRNGFSCVQSWCYCWPVTVFVFVLTTSTYILWLLTRNHQIKLTQLIHFEIHPLPSVAKLWFGGHICPGFTLKCEIARFSLDNFLVIILYWLDILKKTSSKG